MGRRFFYKTLSFIFILLLIIPCLGMLRENRNKELIVAMENRNISPKPTSQLFSADFFEECEKWYNDRLLGRRDLIRLWSKVNGRLFNMLISKEVVLGKDGFLFFPGSLKSILVDESKKIETLNKINKLCQRNNIKFTVFLAPPSEWIFGDLLPERYRPVDLQKMERETGNIFKRNKIDYCFIGQEMASLDIQERKALYYAGDSHWNKNGAFYGASKLLKHIQLDNMINSNIYYKSEIGFGDIYTKKIGWDPIKSKVRVPWSSEFVEDFDVKFNISNRITTDFVGGGSQKGEVIYTNKCAKHKVKVLILGDSFFSDMSNYLLQDIHTIVFSHNCDVSAPKKIIDVSDLVKRYNPDIVIYEKVGAAFYGYTYDAVFGNLKI